MSLADIKPEHYGPLGFSSYRDYLTSEHFSGIRVAALNTGGWSCYYCQGPADHVKFLEFSADVLAGKSPGKVVPICTMCYLL